MVSCYFIVTVISVLFAASMVCSQQTNNLNVLYDKSVAHRKSSDEDILENFVNPFALPLNVSQLSSALRTGQLEASREMFKDYAVSPSQSGSTISSFNKPNEQSLVTGFNGLVNSLALEEAAKRMWGTAWAYESTELGKCIIPTGFCKPDKVCPPVEPQVNSKCDPKVAFRLEEGSCNDLHTPNLGMSGTTFRRLIPNRYADGCDRPREFSLLKTTKCQQLPNPRVVSNTISQSVRAADKHVSLLLATFGQFVDHDLTFTPVYHQKHLGKPAQPLCCPFKTSNQCAPIKIADTDPFYSDYGVECLEFVRSLATTTDPACGLGVRLQINQNSHWLDGSNIYGSGKVSPVVREFYGGQLATSQPYGSKKSGAKDDFTNDFIPISDPDICANGITVNAPCEDNQCCVMAGDLRAGEQPPLASLHTLFMRHHNRVAGIFQNQDPSDDESYYQATRKLVLAQYQFIVYNELLPAYVGEQRMEEYDLKPLKGDAYLPSKKYKPGQGKIFLEFATAAARFGHSLIHDDIYKASKSGGSYRLSDHLNRIDLALTDPKDVGEILKGQCSHAALAMDQHVTGELQNKLFKNFNDFGGDLFATNIQRGRDHGIGTYYDMREYCLGDVSVDPSWTSPVWENVFHKGVLASLMKLYKSPIDVDLFAGGIAEVPVPANQGLVGPTFACVIAKQFQHLKFGDRFWFEFEGLIDSGSQFSPKQLVEIRKSSLARLMCDLTGISTVQEHVLLLSNSTVKCSDAKFRKETEVDYTIFFNLGIPR